MPILAHPPLPVKIPESPDTTKEPALGRLI